MGFNRCCTVALMAVTEKQPLGVVHPQRMEGQQSVWSFRWNDRATRYVTCHLRAGVVELCRTFDCSLVLLHARLR